jgi:hypothetical protein
MVAMSGVPMSGASRDTHILKYSLITKLSLANFCVDTSIAINPYDKALRGLLRILGYEDSKPNWINLGSLQSTMESRLIDFESSVQHLFDPGLESIFETTSTANGLDNLDLLCKILKKETFTHAYSQVVGITVGDPAMGTPDEPRYTLCAAVSDIHYEAEMEGGDPHITVKDLLITSSLTDLLQGANGSVIELFHAYEEIMEQADESTFRLESLYVLRNAEKAVQFTLGIDFDAEGGFRLSDHYDQLEIITDNKDFLADLKKATSTGSSRHYLKGRLLEQELGF